MKKEEEEYLYQWFLKQRKFEFSNTNINWLEILKKKYQEQQYKIRDAANSGIIESEEVQDSHKSDIRDKINFDLNKTTDNSFFDKINCETEMDENHSPEPYLKSDWNCLKTPLMLMNKTDEIAISLGLESDQSSISRISAIFTPCNSKNRDDMKSDFRDNCGIQEQNSSKINRGYSVSEHTTVTEISTPQERLITSVNCDDNSFVEYQTQGFNTDKLMQDRSKFSVDIPTPKTEFNLYKKLPINCTSTPVSHLRSSDARDSRRESLSFKDRINSVSADDSEANSNKDEKKDSRNGLHSCKDTRASTSSSLTSIERDVSSEHKLSLSYLRRKKKKFIYPSTEEKLSDELAVRKEVLIQNINEKITEPVKEIKSEKINIAKQTNFMSACTLPADDFDLDDDFSNIKSNQRENIKVESEKLSKNLPEMDTKFSNKSCKDAGNISYDATKDYQFMLNKQSDSLGVVKGMSNGLKCDVIRNGVDNLADIGKKTSLPANRLPSNSSVSGGLIHNPISNEDGVAKGFESLTSLGQKNSVTSEIFQQSKMVLIDDDHHSTEVKSVNSNKSACVATETAISAETEGYTESRKFNFPGFCSAAGKNIAVNKEALLKAKEMLDDIDDNIMLTSEECNFADDGRNSSKLDKSAVKENLENLNFLGFQTASVSTEAHQKAKAALNDMEDNILLKSDENLKSNTISSLEKLSFPKFHSTLESKLSASKELRDNTKELSNDVQVSHKESDIFNKNNKFSSSLNAFTKETEIGSLQKFAFPGFNSASGKKIHVSLEALKKAKSILEDTENNDSNLEHGRWSKDDDFDKEITLKIPKPLTEFKTDNNKKVNVSPASLLKAEPFEEMQTNAENLEKFSSHAFHSASVSTEAFHKAETILNDMEDNILLKSDENIKVNNAISSLENPSIPNLNSALGSKLSASEELRENTELSSDVQVPDMKLDLFNKNSKFGSSLNAFTNGTENVSLQKLSCPGFNSASGKKIHVSLEALKKAKSILEDTKDDNSNLEDERWSKNDDFDKKITSKNPKPLAGFKTASNKMVIIKPSSMLKAKSLFEEMQMEEEIQLKTLKEKSEAEDMEENSQNIERNLSPIIGSQRTRNHSSRKRSLSGDDIGTSTAAKILKMDAGMNTGKENVSSASGVPKLKKCNTEENMEINEITKAFLLDTSWDDSSFNLEEKNIEGVNSTHPSSTAEERRERRKKQEKIIKIKMESKSQCLNNSEGSLFIFKLRNKEKRVKLSSLTLDKTLKDLSAVGITSKNCGEFRFMADESCVKCEFDDDVEIIPGDDNCIGWKEVEFGFLSSKDVNCCIVPNSWVLNHYSLIVWKLASLQRRLGNNFDKSVFTLEEVVRQLRYRYDLEILGGQRSILRKIIEQDDTPRRTMVLCVSDIQWNSQEDKLYQNNDKKISNCFSSLTLTDGWYFIETQIDGALMAILRRSRSPISVGTKLIIHGSELVGNPTPCHPLNASNETIRLKIHANMCRVASWHSKLGSKLKTSLLPPTPFSCIMENGGPIGCIECLVCRKYPIAFMEKNETKTSIVSERVCEGRKRSAMSKRESMMEEIYYQVEKEIEEEELKQSKRNNNSFDSSSLGNLMDGKQIMEYLLSSNDPHVLQGLSDEQIRLAGYWKEQEVHKKKQKITKIVHSRAKNLKSLYEAVPLLKLGVLDKFGTEAVITVWRPQEEHLAVREGQTFNIYYLSPSSARNDVKQLTWNKQSFIRFSKSSLPLVKLDRNLASDFSNLRLWNLTDVPFREIDVVGIVVSVCDIKDGGQNVFLSDQDLNFICIRFFPSVNELEFQDIITQGNVVSVTNCSLRSQRLGEIVTVMITPFTIISSELQKQFEEPMASLKQELQKNPNLVANAENVLSEYIASIESRGPDDEHKVQTKRNSTSPESPCWVPSKLKTVLNTSDALSKPFRTPIRGSSKS